MELGLFFLAVPIMYKLGDLQTLLKPHNKNWALILPFGAVIGPLLSVGRGQESSLPILLVVPSLFYIGLFAYSMFVELRAGHSQDTDSLNSNKSFQYHSIVKLSGCLVVNGFWVKKLKVPNCLYFKLCKMLKRHN